MTMANNIPGRSRAAAGTGETMARIHEVGRFTTPPEIADIEALAREAFATIPARMRDAANDVAIRVEDFPDDELLEEMDCESPYDLLGLYSGIDLTSQSIMDIRENIDIVFLFRRPILDYWCETGEDLAHIVRHVLIHEIGHHFGFSDDDMERIEAEY